MSTFDDWQKLASGGDAEGLAQLRRTLPTGLEVEPLYPEPRAAAGLAPAPAAMTVTMDYRHWDLGALIAAIGRELAEVTAARAWVTLDRASRIGAGHTLMDEVHVGDDGAVIANRAEMVRLMESGVAMTVDAGANALPVRALLRAAGDQDGLADVACDIYGSWARDGFVPASLSDLHRECAQAGARVVISTLPYHDAGASPAHELGIAIATAIENARGFQDHGAYWQQCEPAFRLGVTPDLFAEVAKLRALRHLWARLRADLGAGGGISVEAVTSGRTTSVREPWVNQLRTTAAALAAQVGGADSLCPRSYDHLAASPTAPGRRVARNTALMLTAESHVGRVADAAAGAGLIEALTDSLARQAWALVQGIEGEGGMASALASGWLRARIDEDWQQTCGRYQDAGVLVGVNEFASEADELQVGTQARDVEAIVARFSEPQDQLELRTLDDAVSAAKSGATIDDLSTALVRGTVAAIEPMPRRRIAADIGWEAGPQ